MDTIAPPASIVNSLFRRPVGREEERRQRRGKHFEADHTETEDEAATVIVETAPVLPAVPPAMLSYAETGHRATDDAASGAVESDPLWASPDAAAAASEASDAEVDPEAVAAAILLAEEEQASREPAKTPNPYGAPPPANPCGGKTDVET